MEYLSRLSGLVVTPAKAAANITGSPRLCKKPSLHPVGSVYIFHSDWEAVKSELENPDERALFFGVARSDLPRRLQRIVDALVFEANRSNDGHTGPCMEYLLKYDILTQLVHLSVDDRPKGIRAETIRTLTNLIILLDEKFLSRHAVNKPISQLIQLCLDEDAARFQLDDDSMDAASSNSPASAAAAAATSDHDEDLVDLMCHIASRIRNTPELLQIFFTDEPIEDGENSDQARSLRDGSIIVSRDLFDDLISGSPKLDGSPHPSETPSNDPALQRPASPAGSVDSTATIQPSTAFPSRKPAKRRLRFPLFSYLLKFVHREGRIGELARAGLLFLISLEGLSPSQKSVAHGAKPRKATKRVSFGTDDIRRSLAVFIAHSDFADVLGAGLGAAYGLLPSRIKPVPRYDPTAVDTQSTKGGTGAGAATITLASSSAGDPPAVSDALASATQSDDADLQAQLRLMVDLIEFCQDVLDSLWLASKHLTDASAASTEEMDEKAPASLDASPDLDPMIRKLARAIAMAIRDTFIRNVVYPSLMESSDFDGSSAAVLNYLDVIVIVLRSGHILTDVALDFLLPTEFVEKSGGGGYDINVPADEADRYSVKDLILDNVDDAKRPATRVAALRLARSLIVCHGIRACGGLFQLARSKLTFSPMEEWIDSFAPDTANASQVLEDNAGVSKINVHFSEIDALSSLLVAFNPTLTPAALQASLSNYLIDAEQALRYNSTFATAIELGSSEQIPLLRTDPFVQQLFAGLAAFFAQPVEVNLATSGVISALAATPIRSLQGWLTHSSQDNAEAEAEAALVELLSGLVEQVRAYRDAVPEFDRYLAERRRSLVLTEDLSDALQVSDVGVEDDEELGGRTLKACISLPRIASSSGKGDRLKMDQQTRVAQREFGIVEDRRSSLPALSAPTAPVESSNANHQPSQPESLGRSSALARLFGGRPSRPALTPSKTTASSVSRPGTGDRKPSASTINPYAEHFRETAAVILRTRVAKGAEGWRPQVKAEDREMEEGRASLSSVLDNTILLEELVKELLAVVQVRRAWGIDRIAFM